MVADLDNSKSLRTLAPFIAEPLAELFKLSLLTADVPEDWRTANICPSFSKTGTEGQQATIDLLVKLQSSARSWSL